jgi:hypothetical protein
MTGKSTNINPCEYTLLTHIDTSTLTHPHAPTDQHAAPPASAAVDFAAACAAVTTATSSAAAAELRQMQKDLERSRTRDKDFRAHVKALKDTHKASFKLTNLLEDQNQIDRQKKEGIDLLFRSLLLLYCRHNNVLNDRLY